ncbi:hypothetical protein AMECASPLE_029785 [Ameca splendens]|uniref:Uncharacterized protein n=1 Tax=Ameca splendens TaxID=208324 RepID=A0ABV0YSV5_9TELE
MHFGPKCVNQLQNQRPSEDAAEVGKSVNVHNKTSSLLAWAERPLREEEAIIVLESSILVTQLNMRSSTDIAVLTSPGIIKPAEKINFRCHFPRILRDDATEAYIWRDKSFITGVFPLSSPLRVYDSLFEIWGNQLLEAKGRGPTFLTADRCNRDINTPGRLLFPFNPNCQ